jgi:serine O-acetyltransferase
MWAWPLWWSVRRASITETVRYDVDRWVRQLEDPYLLDLDPYARFAYLASALSEFRTLVHYRLRKSGAPLRTVLRMVYRPERTLILDAGSIGPGLFIQHGIATLVSAESIGRDCWINQQVSIGFDARRGRPTLGDRVRVGAGAKVFGAITLHDGATIGANATVIHDVPPGVAVVAPLARPIDEVRGSGES